MTYELAIGDRLFSSWSLRGWLAFSAFGIDVKIHATRMYSDEFPKRMAEFAPARTVPALRHDGLIIADSLAIGEYLYERHPEQNLWPRDVAARATARMIVAEMHSSFQALRSACPMNLQYIYDGFNAEDAVLKDRDRIETLWDYAQRFSDNSGPWLFGSFSLADVFYAPIVMRFVTYGLASSDFSKSFCKTFLKYEVFRQWRAMGFSENYIQTIYDKRLPTVPWAGPPPILARPIDHGESENVACPYSGDPITHKLEILEGPHKGRIFGFCNAFCRDKTLADPEAWPKFRALL